MRWTPAKKHAPSSPTILAALPHRHAMPPAPPIRTTTNVYREPVEDPFIQNALDTVPPFVLQHAPLVHLHSQEPFWPASHESHLRNSTLVGIKQPQDTHESQPESQPELPFDILADPSVNHEKCFMTALVDVRNGPGAHPWLVSEDGRPGPSGRSEASAATLILVDKSELTGVPNTLDAFWFFFHSFNLGPTVARIHFGNHIADWEHCMVRFVDGEPMAVHLSSHADGFAYTYKCLEKRGIRPVIYSAYGSHAMYPKPGLHDYSPIKFVGPIDRTDKGPLWDPSLHYRAFQHFPSPARDKFITIEHEKKLDDATSFLACLKFRGHWGDEYSGCGEGFNTIKRKMSLEGLRWGDGVTGPRDKDLDRIGMNRFGDKIRTVIP